MEVTPPVVKASSHKSQVTSRKSPVASPKSKPMEVSLQKLEIKNGAIAFDNRRTKLKASFKGWV